jgi:hypothetical protein
LAENGYETIRKNGERGDTTMTSSSTSTMPTFANTDPLTLCTETLAVLADQAKTKTYTKGVETYFSPDISKEEMAKRLQMFGDVSVRDYRQRPQRQLDGAGQPYKDDYLTEQYKKSSAEREAHGKALYALPYKEENKEERHRLAVLEERARNTANFYRQMPDELANWRPQRLVALDLYVNHHKRDDYEETAQKHPDDKFVQQIWSCIRQRCETMDEANKERGNPMRNIHMALYFTPAETYFSCDWETAKPMEHAIVFGHHQTEYRLDDSGEVVCFQSNITIRRIEKEAQEEAKKQADKRAEAERKAKEEADYLASLTHHTDQWGHRFTQVGTKKVTARYDEVWVLEDYKKQNGWFDLASVARMEKVYSGKFLAVRVADDATHSLFVCEAMTTDYSAKTIVRTPALFTFRIEKGKGGKFKDDNKTKQLRVSEKIDLSQFPKNA